MKIFRVLQVSVIKVSESPLTLSIQAQGLAATSGWTNPRLDNSADPNPDDSILEFNFDADRPSGISLPVLSPIMATVDFTPSNGADAVIVTARTNSITVHAGEFINPGDSPAQPTTLAFGEEEPSTRALGEEGPPQPPQPTTLAVGEEDPRFTTLALGEEEPSTRAAGEASQPTTRAVGEEQPEFTTLAIGEESSPFGRY